MYSIPNNYRKEVIINKENFIPKKEKAINKKKIKSSLEQVKLKYQIIEGIPNLINENFNVQVIMLLEVKLKSMKDVNYINEIFQKLLKSYAVIKYTCDGKVALGYGYKRLNLKNPNEIILEDSFVTKEFEELFLFEEFNLYEKNLSFNNIKNKNNKLDFYLENMVKAYVISNRDYFKNIEEVLKSEVFYSYKSTFNFYNLLKRKVKIKDELKLKKLTSEKIDLNKELIKVNQQLEGVLNGKD